MIAFVTASDLVAYESFAFLPSYVWMVVIIFVAFFIVGLIGYLEFKLKTFQKEMVFLSCRNPVMAKIMDNQKRMMDKIGVEYEDGFNTQE